MLLQEIVVVRLRSMIVIEACSHRCINCGGRDHIVISVGIYMSNLFTHHVVLDSSGHFPKKDSAA